MYPPSTQALYLGTQAFFYCFRDLKDVTEGEAQGDYRCIPKGYCMHSKKYLVVLQVPNHSASV